MSSTDQNNNTNKFTNVLRPVDAKNQEKFNGRMGTQLKVMKAPSPLSSLEEFKEFLTSTGLILAGSFPLKIAAEFPTVRTIVDLYIVEKSIKSIKNFILGSPWEKVVDPVIKSENNNYISSFKQAGITININRIGNDNNYPEFDLDLCMLAYDGKNWLLPIDTFVDDILERKMYINAPYVMKGNNICNLLKHIRKYGGFKITDNHLFKHILRSTDNSTWLSKDRNAFWKSLFKYPRTGWLNFFSKLPETWPNCDDKETDLDYAPTYGPNNACFKAYFAEDIKTTDTCYLKEIYTDEKIAKLTQASVPENLDNKHESVAAKFPMPYRTSYEFFCDEMRENDPVYYACKMTSDIFNNAWRGLASKGCDRYHVMARKDEDERYIKELKTLYDTIPGIRLFRVINHNNTMDEVQDNLRYEAEKRRFDGWNLLSENMKASYADIEASLTTQAFTDFEKSIEHNASAYVPDTEPIKKWYNKMITQNNTQPDTHSDASPDNQPPSEAPTEAPTTMPDLTEDDWSASTMATRSELFLKTQEEAHNKSLKEIVEKIRTAADTGSKNIVTSTFLSERVIADLKNKGYKVTDDSGSMKIISW